MIKLETTQFRKRDGSLSSVRLTLGSGDNKMSMTQYINSSKGGVTFRNNGMTTRLNNKGQSISTGFKTGNKMTYFGSNGVSDRIAPF